MGGEPSGKIDVFINKQYTILINDRIVNILIMETTILFWEIFHLSYLIVRLKQRRLRSRFLNIIDGG